VQWLDLASGGSNQESRTPTVRSIRNEYHPDSVSLPGETLEEVLTDRQMTQVDLATRSALSLKTINEIIKGKAAITPETALQLERVLGVPASFWNSLERNYREHLARQTRGRG
jgi:HTH-type transcriptional regulator / antitoxin HigA